MKHNKTCLVNLNNPACTPKYDCTCSREEMRMPSPMEATGDWEERFDKLPIFSVPIIENVDSVRTFVVDISIVKSFIRSELSRAVEEERQRIDKAVTEQFKYASEHDNYDIRGIDWSVIIHQKSVELTSELTTLEK